MPNTVELNRGKTLTWLHLSDLHFEPPGGGTDFDRSQVLHGVIEMVREYRTTLGWIPDLIFVTGDIANYGGVREYAEATQFFDKLLVATELTKDRLFVVPGNHDVERAQAWLLERTLSDNIASDTFFANAPPSPTPTPTAESRHLSKLKNFSDWHAHYFAGVHETDRISVCATATVIEVRDLRIGVLPLNTATFCVDDHDYGKLWVGRAWLHRVLAHLADPHLHLRVALHHHPLDWLHDAERSQIRATLLDHVDVLLRGHLHETETEATVSTSRKVFQLAAGATWQAPKWPRRLLFTRIDFDRQTLRVHPVRFEIEPRRRWTLDTSLFPPETGYEGVYSIAPLTRGNIIPHNDASRPLGSMASVARHARTWTIFPDGIAEVDVALTRVEVSDGLVLAAPDRPFCAVLGDGHTSTPAGVPVVCDDRHAHTVRFHLDRPGSFPELAWRYTISNAFALDQSEAQLLHPLGEAMVGRPHVVRYPCEQLSVTYEFPDAEWSDVRVVERAEARVEERFERHGQTSWERSQLAENACRVEMQPDGRRATLTVDRPIVGRRYTLVVVPARPGTPTPRQDQVLAQQLVRRCRESREVGGLVGDLSDALQARIEELVPRPLGKGTSWIGFVWNAERSLLLPGFGRFANQQWSVRFSFGGGVAGHAFRFSRPAVWHRDGVTRTSVLYQPKTSEGSSYSGDYRWVVCIPLLLSAGGPSIGVLSLASTDEDGGGEEWLSSLAQRPDDPDHQAALEKLAGELNVAFWGALRQSQNATDALQRWAKSILERAKT